jgi:hypothetical protein
LDIFICEGIEEGTWYWEVTILTDEQKIDINAVKNEGDDYSCSSPPPIFQMNPYITSAYSNYGYSQLFNGNNTSSRLTPHIRVGICGVESSTDSSLV